jgi:membrane protease subunit HflK
MAWNEPGGNRSPWGKRPEQGPPDLDEVVRNLQKRLSGLFGGRGSGQGGGQGSSSGSSGGGGGGARGLGLGAIVAILLVVWGFTGLYTVDAAERAVVLRFGKYQSTQQPGLRWHIPWPVERKVLVNVGTIESFADDTRMLTSDENLVDIDLAVQYRRADPLMFLFNVRDPESTLKEVSESAIREVVGRSGLDFVLEEGRQEIAARTKELIQRTLDGYQTGISVTTVNLQDVKVPDQVRPAQQDAIKAREDKERLALEAQAYANDILPKARGAAARRIQDAQAYRARVIADAEGEAQRFTQLLEAYSRAPDVTRKRLYLETMESVLGESRKVLIGPEGTGNLMYLPIDKLLEQSRASMQEAPRDSASTVRRTGDSGGSSAMSNDDLRQRGTR